MKDPERLGHYLFHQSETCFPLGMDTLLLGAFATLRPGWRVCDLGCGAGALPLLLLEREASLHLTGIELREEDAALARWNLAQNGLEGEILTGDLRRARDHLPGGCFELIVSNPPYFACNSGKSGGAARMEETCTLDELCACAGYLVKNGGRFALVYRPERLTELMECLRGHGLEPKRMQLVQHRLDKPPAAVLLEAVRQGRPGLEILPVRLITQPE